MNWLCNEQGRDPANNMAASVVSFQNRIKIYCRRSCGATNRYFFFFYIKVVTKGMVSRGSGGSIVNISSVAGFRAVPNHTIYCTAKAALDMLSMTLALELGPHKVILTFFPLSFFRVS